MTSFLSKVSILIAIIGGFTACNNNDDDIKFYTQNESYEYNIKISSLATSITASPSIRVAGGSEVYTVKSSNEEIMSVYMSNKHLYMVVHKLGTVIVTVTDSENSTASLPVSVSEGIRNIEVLNAFAYVKVENETEGNKLLIELINKDIESKLLLKGTRYKLMYTSKTEGRLTVYSKTEGKDNVVEGSFVEERNDADIYPVFKFQYNNAVRVYQVGDYRINPDNKQKASYPSLLYMVEDYTTAYPLLTGVDITEALGIQHIYMTP